MKPILLTLPTILVASEVDAVEGVSNIIIRIGVTASIIFGCIYLALQIVKLLSEDKRADNHVLITIVDLLKSAVGSIEAAIREGNVETSKNAAVVAALIGTLKASETKITDLEGLNVSVKELVTHRGSDILKALHEVQGKLDLLTEALSGVHEKLDRMNESQEAE